MVDYTTDDFVERGPFDVIVDIVGTRSTRDLKRAVTDDGVYVMVGATSGGPVLGPLTRLIGAVVSFAFASQKAKMWIADPNADDLNLLGEMLGEGTLVWSSTAPTRSRRRLQLWNTSPPATRPAR